MKRGFYKMNKKSCYLYAGVFSITLLSPQMMLSIKFAISVVVKEQDCTHMIALPFLQVPAARHRADIPKVNGQNVIPRPIHALEPSL